MNVSAISALAQAVPAAGTAPAGAHARPSAAGATAADRKKAAAQFEAILVRQLLDKSVGSMMGGTGHTAGLMYGDMMTTVLAQKMSEGQGLGLGRMIEKQLSPKPTGPVTPFANPSK
jgi:Rod binding domain-containing protein